MRFSLFLIPFLVLGFASVATAAPTIQSFSVSDGVTSSETQIQAAPGAVLTLSWEVTGADSVLVVPGVGPAPLVGSAMVTFGSQPTTYFLNATGGGFTQGSVTVTVDPAAVDPVISEFLANPNEMSFTDEDGDRSDWIELRNPYGFELEVGGYFLTDGPELLTKWQIPAGTVIPANGELLLFASGKDRTTVGQRLHTNFRLDAGGDDLILVKADGTTIVEQAQWSEHPAGKSYGFLGEREGFFVTATPEAENTLPFFTPEKVTLNQASQAFTGSIEVALESPDPALEIRYTTDRSEPDGNSPLYNGPFTFLESTMLRARLMGQDVIGDISGRHYLELSQDAIPAADQAGATNLGGFTSNLPIVVVDTVGPGGELQDGLRATTFSVYEPVNGVASFVNTPTLTSRAGYRIRGQSSAGFAKKQYRFELWNQENEDKDQELLGMPSDSDFILGAPFVDKSLIRNSLVYELGRELGLDAPRTRHVEVFLNTNGGELNYETDYLGVYFVGETNKITNDRIDLKKLDEDDVTEPEISGGYMMKWEQNVSEASKRVPSFSNLELVDPDGAEEATTVQKTWLSNYLQEADARVKSEDRGDPVAGYAPVIDVPSYVNLLVVNELARDQDGYMRSAYMYKDRGGKIMQGPLWDYNLGMGTGCCRNNRNTAPMGSDSGWQYIENTVASEHKWERDLVKDPDFWQAFVDRWQEVRGGILDESSLHARMDEQAGPLQQAAVRNFAKWNNLGSTNFTFFDSPASEDYQGQIDFMKTWTTERMGWIDSQMTTPPTVTPMSGLVTMGSSASVNGLEGTIYYTTDGSDPRLDGGMIHPEAQIFTGTGLQDLPLITRADNWAYLDDGSDQGDSDTPSTPAHWTHPDFDDSSWANGAAPLGYSNGVTTTVDDGGVFNDRHITTYFRRKFTVSDPAQILELEMEVQYDDGVLVYLNGVLQERFNMPDGVVHFDLVASSGQSGVEETAWIPFTLNPEDLVAGENIIALELHQQSAGSSDLSFDFSLTGREAAGSPPEIPITETTVITARALEGEDWSGPQRQIYVVGTPANQENLVLSELNYHPAEPDVAEMNAGFLDQDDFEFLELLNISSETIDLSGLHFSEGIDFALPFGCTLTAGERILVVRNTAAIQQRYPSVTMAAIVGEFQNDTGLSNSGERLTLLSATDEVIFSIRYNDDSPWPEVADGDGGALALIDPFGNPDATEGVQWRSAANGGSPSVSDGALFGGGNGADLLRYATGDFIPKIVRYADGTVELKITLNLLADDLEGELQMSSALSSWSDAASLFRRESLDELGNGLGILTLRSNFRVPDKEVFFRYYVSLR